MERCDGSSKRADFTALKKSQWTQGLSGLIGHRKHTQHSQTPPTFTRAQQSFTPLRSARVLPPFPCFLSTVPAVYKVICCWADKHQWGLSGAFRCAWWKWRRRETVAVRVTMVTNTHTNLCLLHQCWRSHREGNQQKDTTAQKWVTVSVKFTISDSLTTQNLFTPGIRIYFRQSDGEDRTKKGFYNS